MNERQDYTFHETGDKHLAYANEFRAMLKEHPGIVGRALEMMDEEVTNYDPPPMKLNDTYSLEWNKAEMRWYDRNSKTGQTEPAAGAFGLIFFSPAQTQQDKDSGLELCLLGVMRREGQVFPGEQKRHHADYFKAKMGSQSYFVKRAPVIYTSGFGEFQNTMKAKEVLSDLDFVRVVEPQFAYTSKNENIYISDWEDIESGGFTEYMVALDSGGLNHYGKLSAGVNSEDYEKFERIEAKYKLIKSRLENKGLAGDMMVNTYVNPETEEFIVIDLTSSEDQAHGNPIQDQ